MKAFLRLQPCSALCLLIFSLSLLSPPNVRAQATEELITALEKSTAPREGYAGDPTVSRLVEMVKQSLASGRLAEAEQYLTSIRSTSAVNNEVTGLINQLRAAVQEQIAAADVKRRATVEAILGEAAALFTSRAPGGDFDPLLKRLASIPAAPPNQYNDLSTQSIEMARTFIIHCQDYILQSTASNFDQAGNVLNEMVQLSSRVPVIPRSELIALQVELSKRPATGGNAASARLDTLRKMVEKAIDSATSAVDLDVVLFEIAKPIPSDGNRGSSSNNFFNQLEALRRFTRRWQDYLSQVEAGNNNAASTSLRELANDTAFETVYPRSRILARISGKSVVKADPTSKETLLAPDELTLETLDQFSNQVTAGQMNVILTGGDQPNSAYAPRGLTSSDLASETARLLSAFHQLKLGNTQPAISLTKYQGSVDRLGAYAMACARLQQELVLRALPMHIRAPSDVKTSNAETPERYLQRVVQRACEIKDWQLAFRALTTIQNLQAQFTMGTGGPELEGFRLFFVGMNQERAGEWISASQSYMTALRTVSSYLPAEEIGRRLEVIKASHPEDYKIAQKEPYPPNSGPNTPPGMYPGLPGRYIPNGPVPPGSQGRNVDPRLLRGSPMGPPPPPPSPEPDASRPVSRSTAQEKSSQPAPKE